MEIVFDPLDRLFGMPAQAELSQPEAVIRAVVADQERTLYRLTKFCQAELLSPPETTSDSLRRKAIIEGKQIKLIAPRARRRHDTTPRAPSGPRLRPRRVRFLHADVRVSLAQTAWRNRHASIIERAADMDNASNDNDQPVTQYDDGSVIEVDLIAEYEDDGAGKDADKVAKKDTDDYFSADIMGDETDDSAKTPTEVVSVGNGVDDEMDVGEDDMEEEADEVEEDVVEDEMVDDASSTPGVPVANEKIIPENVAPPAPRKICCHSRSWQF
jgi:hypothetical protein